MPDEPGTGEVYEFTLDEYDADERIDQVLSARLPDLSRTHIQKLIRDGKLTVNGKAWDNLNKPFELDFTPDYATTNVAEMNGRDIIGIKYSQDKMELEINDTEMSRDNYRVSVFFEKVK